MNDIAGNLTSRPADGVKAEASDADAGFYLTMVLVSAVIIFVGFSPSFYLKSVIHAPPPLTQLSITHGLVFTAWTLLFIAQVSLIARKQRSRTAPSSSPRIV